MKNLTLPVLSLMSLVAGLLLTTPLAAAQPQARPLRKIGACPIGYYTSGTYCQPSRGAPHAIEKVKNRNCPTGYYTNGAYCVSASRRSTTPNNSPRPQVVKKIGLCPTGYYSNGAYCQPTQRAPFAVEKVGSCPSQYYSSGNYCLASSTRSKHAILKVGPCPSGYYSNGAYCLALR